MTRNIQTTLFLIGSVALGTLLAIAGSPAGALGGESEPVSGNAARQVVALATPRSAGDDLPGFLADFASQAPPSGTPDDLFEGNWLINRSRRLSTDGFGDALYAVPTDRGNVCFTITVPASSYRSENGGGGCVLNFDAGTPIGFATYDSDEIGAGHPVIVGGVVPDNVVGISIGVDGKSRQVDISGGGFLYVLDSPAAYPGTITVSYADGRSREIALVDHGVATLDASAG